MAQTVIVQFEFVWVRASSVAWAVYVVSEFGYAEVTSTEPFVTPPTWKPPPNTRVPAGQLTETSFGETELFADVALTRWMLS
jgi:hypothetical protein